LQIFESSHRLGDETLGRVTHFTVAEDHRAGAGMSLRNAIG